MYNSTANFFVLFINKSNKIDIINIIILAFIIDKIWKIVSDF